MAASPYALPTFVPGPRLIDGSDLNKLGQNLGREVVVLPIPSLAGLADAQARTITLPYPFKVLSAQTVVDDPVTTAAKASTLTVQVGGSSVTGGVMALTSANMTPAGAAVAATAITQNSAALSNASSATLGVLVSSTTAFAEGSAHVEFVIQRV